MPSVVLSTVAGAAKNSKPHIPDSTDLWPKATAIEASGIRSVLNSSHVPVTSVSNST
ncbi:MAG: hypothetical protein NWP61_04680 [Rickettsiaceae bacterium]|nr:hypothetical protein [Rickettsiaceae bacterium]